MKTTETLITILGATLLLSMGVAPATAAPASDGLEAGETAFVDVSVATLWAEPNTARAIDAPALANPVDLDAWNAAMPDTETRRWLTGKLETQAVLGSKVEVTEVDGEWAHVLVAGQPTPRDERGYPGWVPVRQLVENDRFAWREEGTERAVVTAKTTWLSGTPNGKHHREKISFNTELPVVNTTPKAVHVALPNGSKAWIDADAVEVYATDEDPPVPTGADLVDTGQQFLGLRYLWAGVSAFGFDCSGFTSSVYRAHGITIPRDASAQATGGQDVAPEDLRAGDLLFFAQPGGTGNVHHVGMYIGDGKMIHAPNASTTVQIVDWNQWDTNDEFSGAQRFL